MLVQASHHVFSFFTSVHNPLIPLLVPAEQALLFYLLVVRQNVKSHLDLVRRDSAQDRPNCKCSSKRCPSARLLSAVPDELSLCFDSRVSLHVDLCEVPCRDSQFDRLPSFIILGLFVATLLIFALFRFHRYGLSKSKGRAHAGSALGAFSRSISEAPLFGTRRAQPYSALHGFLSFRAPVRLHTVVIFCFCLINILCITSFYETWAGPDNPRCVPLLLHLLMGR
jgi:hypothetical protein